MLSRKYVSVSSTLSRLNCKRWIANLGKRLRKQRIPRISKQLLNCKTVRKKQKNWRIYRTSKPNRPIYYLIIIGKSLRKRGLNRCRLSKSSKTMRRSSIESSIITKSTAIIIDHPNEFTAMCLEIKKYRFVLKIINR